MTRFSESGRNFLFTSFLIITLFIFSGNPLGAEETDVVRGSAVVVPVFQGSVQLNAMLNKSRISINKVMNRLGRFLPVELNRLESAVNDAGVMKTVGDYDRLASRLDVSLYILLSAYRRGRTIYVQMKVVPLDKAFGHLRKNILIKSYNPTMVPTKCARQAAVLHRDLSLRVKVESCSAHTCRINAGQWHGVTEGELRSAEGISLKILSVERYRSTVAKTGRISPGMILTGNIKVNEEPLVRELETLLERQIIHRYGAENTLMKGNDPEKRMLEGACIINPGANFCLPGYGAHLATSYLGFKDLKPHVPGVAATATLMVMHFTLTEMLTGFKSNFAPWVQDGDKSNGMKNLHVFLWASLPLTMTAGWLDQLAFQYRKSNTLPPYFNDHDRAAAAMSFFCPGAGHFYKGYSLTGWGYYGFEMTLASLTAWYGGKKGKTWIYLLGGLGSLKVLEMIHAYLAAPDFPVYRYEKELPKEHAVFSFMMRPSETGDPVFAGALTFSF